jgi:hypothetical protein
MQPHLGSVGFYRCDLIGCFSSIEPEEDMQNYALRWSGLDCRICYPVLSVDTFMRTKTWMNDPGVFC